MTYTKRKKPSKDWPLVKILGKRQTHSDERSDTNLLPNGLAEKRPLAVLIDLEEQLEQQIGEIPEVS